MIVEYVLRHTLFYTLGGGCVRLVIVTWQENSTAVLVTRTDGSRGDGIGVCLSFCIHKIRWGYDGWMWKERWVDCFFCFLGAEERKTCSAVIPGTGQNSTMPEADDGQLPEPPGLCMTSTKHP